MDGDKVVDEARALETRFVQFEQFWKDLVRCNDLLKREIVVMSDRLYMLDWEINNLQMKKAGLDKLKCKLETNLDDIKDKKQHSDILQVHLDALNKRKDVLENYSLEKGLQIKEEALKEKLDNAWKYFIDKKSQLEEEIKRAESKLANRKETVSKMYDEECNKYKKKIQKLKEENNMLEERLCLLCKQKEN